MRELLFEIRIPQYPVFVRMAEARRAKYFKKGQRVLKKYSDTSKYDFKDGYLIDLSTRQRVIANPDQVGTPRSAKITGQKFYAGFSNGGERNSMVSKIKAAFGEGLKQFPTITIDQYPLQFDMEIHTTVDNGDWDCSNLWIYTKCIEDQLVEDGKLVDDCIKYISKPAIPEFFPIENFDERVMVIKVYKDTNPAKAWWYDKIKKEENYGERIIRKPKKVKTKSTKSSRTNKKL